MHPAKLFRLKYVKSMRFEYFFDETFYHTMFYKSILIGN